jgi:hypothetical protein
LGLFQLAMRSVPVQQVPMVPALLLPVMHLVSMMRLAAMTGWSLAISASIRPGLAYALYAPAE